MHCGVVAIHVIRLDARHDTLWQGEAAEVRGSCEHAPHHLKLYVVSMGSIRRKLGINPPCISMPVNSYSAYEHLAHSR
jgi:hypothetical protein